ncbi:TetR/AcrR family transcriptional regulator [Iamia sp. SCSIO 61187]|uniref:TetR/AcrR family transcriptional regulator n=1 Tax=Iamia sp. SCSIO 61187 TaxID=2722752 RepID=UPI001C63AD5A|nr:TetR/AcrR family transcriptional regulator [Iamia sp. SCSIO 61187]QYG94210.1 TetR/AcrR family transcriptional regulator [Iamia sp. SCSIO 61187]
MPRVRTGTIAGHRREVRDAILDASARMVGAGGLHSVTMAGLAQEAGIGRATLYKYFAGVDEVLVAWHERLLEEHVRALRAEVEGQPDPAEQLVRGLRAYTELTAHEPSEAAGALHGRGHAQGSADEVESLFTDLIDAAARHGAVRDDVAPRELAVFCIGALGGARHLPSKAAARRLVATVLEGLRFEGSAI